MLSGAVPDSSGRPLAGRGPFGRSKHVGNPAGAVPLREVAVVQAGRVPALDAVLAALAALVDLDGDPVAHLELVHAGPQGGDGARVLVPHDELGRGLPRERPVEHFQIRPADGGDVHAQQDLAGRGRGVGSGPRLHVVAISSPSVLATGRSGCWANTALIGAPRSTSGGTRRQACGASTTGGSTASMGSASRCPTSRRRATSRRRCAIRPIPAPSGVASSGRTWGRPVLRPRCPISNGRWRRTRGGSSRSSIRSATISRRSKAGSTPPTSPFSTAWSTRVTTPSGATSTKPPPGSPSPSSSRGLRIWRWWTRRTAP